MRLASLLRIAVVVVVCGFVLPSMAFAGACVSESISSLVGTSCSIGDVEYNFLSFSGTGISASALEFTPGGTALDPSFSVGGVQGGATSLTTSGLGSSASAGFTFLWSATVIPSGLEIGSATNTINGALVPVSPSFGLVEAGNNYGIPTFTNAIVQTGGPNANPDSALIELETIPLDGMFFGMYVQDGTGSGATTSFTSTSYQYFVIPTPEPASLVLLASGLLGLGLASKQILTNKV